jgi:hypothetical protein
LGTAKSLKVQEAVWAGAVVAKTRRRRRGEILKNTFTFMVHLAREILTGALARLVPSCSC